MRQVTVTHDDGSTTTYTGALLTPGDVAAMFGVSPKTVARWDRLGKLTSVRTAGNHRRYISEQVTALLTQGMREERP